MKKRVTRNTKTAKTSDRRQLDVASVWINPEWNEEEQIWEAVSLSTTDGGVEFNAEIEYRIREFDGYTGYDTKGDRIAESASVTATAQLAELTHAIVQKIIKADIVDHPSGGKELKPTKKIRDHDYIDTVGLFGQLPTGEWTIILMKNVLITSPLNLSTEHNGDLTVEIEMTAHLDDLAPDADLDSLPYSMIMPEIMEPASAELQVVKETEESNGGE